MLELREIKKRGGIVKILLLLAISILFLLNSYDVFAADCYNASADPITLCTCEDLNLTRDDLTANYQLQNNINCTNTSTWNTDTGFTPIGDSSTKFTGTFDGQNYNITDLSINRSSTSYVGLFGYTNLDASIYDVSLLNVNVTGYEYVGSLVGYSYNTSVTNCHMTGNVSSNYYRLGGLIGQTTYGNVTGCSADVELTSLTSDSILIGGLIGQIYTRTVVADCEANIFYNGSTGETVGGFAGGIHYYSTTNNCSASGEIIGLNSLGGFVGAINNNPLVNNSWSSTTVTLNYTGDSYYMLGGFAGSAQSSAMKNCYSIGNVSATFDENSIYMGGFLGRQWNGAVTIYDSYSTGNVTTVSTDSQIGGFTGTGPDSGDDFQRLYSTGKVTGSSAGGFSGSTGTDYCVDCFWDNQTSGKTVGYAGETQKSTAEMKNLTTFTDTATVGLTTAWDFAQDPNDDTGNSDYWYIDATINDGYPFLLGFGIGEGYLDVSGPLIEFQSPTPVDNAAVSVNSVEINTSITESNLTDLIYNWNGTNFTMYNESLVLMMNFDNVSALGENDTHVFDIGQWELNGTLGEAADADSGATSSGKYGGAFEFDGSGDEIDLGNDPKVRITAPITLSAWFKADTYDTSSRNMISKDGNGFEGYSIRIHGLSSRGICCISGSSYILNTGVEPNIGQWYHVVLTDDGTSLKCFIDGIQKGSTGSDPVIDSTVNLFIGDGFDGMIDEARIYNRALTADEVYQQYVTNLRKIDSDSWELYVNQSLNATDVLDETVYNYTVYGMDSVNNSRTLQRNVTVDRTNPTFTNISNQTVEFDVAFELDINATDNIELSSFSVNDTNFTIDSEGILENSTLLALGTYYLNITINDTASNENSEAIWINVTDTIAPIFTNISNTSVYDLDILGHAITATDAHGVQCFDVNDTTNFQINCTGYLENKTSLTEGLHTLNITINDSTGNQNWSTLIINVSKKPILEVAMITPSVTSTNITQNQNFEVSANITCTRTDCGEINTTLKAIFGNESDVNVAFVCYNSGCTDADDLTDYLDGEGLQLTENRYSSWTDAALNSSAFDVILVGGYYYANIYAFDSAGDAARDAYENEQIPLVSASDYSYPSYYLGITNSVGSYDGSENNIINISNHNIMTGFSGTVGVDTYSDDVGYLTTSQMTDPYTKLFAHEDGGGDEISGFALDAGQATVGTNPNRFVQVSFDTYDDYPTATGNDSLIIKQATCWAATGSYDCAYLQSVTNDTTATPFNLNSTNPNAITLNEDESITVTWTVNATGTTNETYVFSVNATQTSDVVITNVSNTWNITISGDDSIAPTFTDIANLTIEFDTMVAYDINATDASGTDCFSINDSTNFEINCTGYLENKTNLSLGVYWLNVSVNDTVGNNASTLIWVNVTDTVAPNITIISPENNYESNTSTQVSFVFNVTDSLLSNTNCSLLINDTYYQGNDSITNNTNNYTETLDYGNYSWFISCFDSLNNTQNTTSRNLSVVFLYGNLNIDWIIPTANINVNQNEFFEMQVNVSCAGGSCGNLTITLDPEAINETNNETETNETEEVNEEVAEIYEDVVDDITQETDFNFFTLEDTYTLGETIYFYVLPTNATYEINITPMSGTLTDLEFTPNQTGNYSITSTLNFENESESFNLTITIMEQSNETQSNTTEAQTFEEGENITQEDKHLGEKLEDEINFETYFTSMTQTNTTLTVTFYHDYSQSLPVWIEGDITYQLSTTSAEPYENTTLEVILVEGIVPRFNLHLGEESEVFEFGKVIPDVDIDHGETELIDRNDAKLDINITKNNNTIKLEGVEEETDIYSYIEPTDDFATDIIAVEPLEIEQATITLQATTLISAIFECPDEYFNYETLECDDWQETNISFTQEDNLVEFTVTHFSGYAGGNLTNNQTSYLTIWDELDQGEPNTTNTKSLNQNTLFFADYKITQNLSRITDGNCTLNFSNTLYPMTYNTSYTYYVANRSFASAGLYTYTIACTHSTYDNITATDTIGVPTNKGVVPTTVSSPFYTNNSNPQTCLNMNQTSECIITWWVNATGAPLTYEFYAYANSSYDENDVNSVNSSFLNITIRSNETTAPLILTANSTPIIVYTGQNITLLSTASDNNQLDTCYANITLPNASIVQYNNTCTQQQTHTTDVLGTHNITFVINDTSGNIVTDTGNYFIVYAPLNFTTTMNSSNGTLNTNLQLYHTNTQILIRGDDVNGSYNETIPDTVYDLLYQSYADRFQVRLRQVNMSDEITNNFGMDRTTTPAESQLVTYAIETNYTFTNATVIVYYDDINYTNEDALVLYKCDDWDFTLQQCNGTWEDVTDNSTQDSTNNYFTYITTSFSGFGVGESSSSSSSGISSGGAGNNLPLNITNTTQPSETCTPDWQCADWQECKNDLKRRYCYDINDCRSPVAAPHMIESCDDLAQTTVMTSKETETTPTQTEQEVIVDLKTDKKTDNTKLGYTLLIILLISWFIYVCYKNKSKLKTFNLNKELNKLFKKNNLNKFKQNSNKKLPKSLKQLKDWFYRF
jgi:hypothetical protein